MKSHVLLFIGFCVTAIRSEWIDPHSMDSNHKKNLPNRSPAIHNHHQLTIKNDCDADIHLKRIVRLILNNAYLDNEIGYHTGYINIKLSASEHQLLINFSQGIAIKDGNIFNEISSIFESAFAKPAEDRYPELILSIQDKLFNLVFNPTSTALVCACFTLLLTYRLLRAQFTWKSIVKYFLFIAYIIDFIVTYLNIVQEEEIESMVNLKKLGAAPPECDPRKMTWWGYFQTQFASTFGENPCTAYYRATYQKYFHIIAPSKILVKQIKTLIVEPFGDFGEALGKFGRNLFTALPWGLNIIIFPIMLIAVLFFTFIVFLFITKSSFKVSLFHLFTIELGNSNNQTLPIQSDRNNQRQIESSRSRRRRIREVGLDKNHRALVEEISNDDSSSHDKKLVQRAEDKKDPSDTLMVEVEEKQTK